MLRPSNLSRLTAENIVKATCVLHSFLRSKGDSVYCSATFMDTEGATGKIAQDLWRAQEAAAPTFGFQQIPARKFALTTSDGRNTYMQCTFLRKTWFLGRGPVPVLHRLLVHEDSVFSRTLYSSTNELLLKLALPHP